MQARIFSHGCVRDLAWAGFSPTLLTGAAFNGTGLSYPGFWQSHLEQLDADPEPLLEFLGETVEGRLGLYYERLWQYLLDRDPGIELLAHNLPVRDGHKTVGEFDCLYWSAREQQHVHLELAVKFYLGLPGPGIWLGPDGRDRLDIKLDRMLGHQGKLAQHPAAREPLGELGITSCQSLIDFKGYLFEPPSTMVPPPDYNAACPLQRWYTLSAFHALPPLQPGWMGWQKIPRRRWLSPFLASEGTVRDPAALADWLQRRMEGSGRPAQFAACDANGVEQYRCFVTPDGWPEN